jgi:hypothetical protein
MELQGCLGKTQGWEPRVQSTTSLEVLSANRSPDMAVNSEQRLTTDSEETVLLRHSGKQFVETKDVEKLTSQD